MASDEQMIAARYVSALFELATEQTAHDAVKQDMLALKSVLADSALLQKMLVNPIITRAQSEELITAALDAIKANALTKQFFTVLARQRRLAITALIADKYLAALAESRGEITAEVTSATPLDADQLQVLSDALSKTTGKKVHVNAQENASLIGGVQVRIGSQMLDNSIATKLERLRQSLSKAA